MVQRERRFWPVAQRGGAIVKLKSPANRAPRPLQSVYLRKNVEDATGVERIILGWIITVRTRADGINGVSRILQSGCV
jgi:hypothetical protein